VTGKKISLPQGADKTKYKLTFSGGFMMPEDTHNKINERKKLLGGRLFSVKQGELEELAEREALVDQNQIFSALGIVDNAGILE